MADAGGQLRRGLARRSVGVESAASLVERAVELAATVSDGAIVGVASGFQHTLAVRRDGSLWACGGNLRCALGIGLREEGQRPDRPTRVGGDVDWAAVTAGYDHTLALKRDGSLWAWGSNEYGQLGLDDDAAPRDHPQRVGEDGDWTAVAAGSGYSLGLKSDGSLWEWGVITVGRFGLVEPLRSELPTRVGGDSDWAFVTADWSHHLALKRDGSLWAWGKNEEGQLGLGDDAPRDRPSLVGGDADWAAVTAGHGHTLAVKRDGSLWAWGENREGSLGLGDEENRDLPTRVGEHGEWVCAAAGICHSLAIKRDGSLWAWGDNREGQLGLGGDGENCDRPTRIGEDHDWSSLAAGLYESFALKRDGSLWAWGSNIAGKLGIGVGPSRDRPTRAFWFEGRSILSDHASG